MTSSFLSKGFVKLVNFGNRFYQPGSSRSGCCNFFIDDRHVGFVRPDVLPHLLHYPDVFSVRDLSSGTQQVHLSPSLTSFDDRTEHVAAVLQDLRRKDVFITLRGWRNEDYNVWDRFSDPPLMKMERSATCLFGVKQYGVHINGYTNHSTKGLCVWVAKRSQTKPTWPGKLDQMVAGGLASNQSIMECAIKESKEEASVSDEILKNLKPVGTVSYFYEDERCLFPECQFVMDLEVPESFVPVNADGEAECFMLMTISELEESIISDEFKFNCAIVNLDFLLRHSLIKPDEEPYYSYLVENVHRTL